MPIVLATALFSPFSVNEVTQKLNLAKSREFGSINVNPPKFNYKLQLIHIHDSNKRLILRQQFFVDDSRFYII